MVAIFWVFHNNTSLACRDDIGIRYVSKLITQSVLMASLRELAAPTVLWYLHHLIVKIFIESFHSLFSFSAFNTIFIVMRSTHMLLSFLLCGLVFCFRKISLIDQISADVKLRTIFWHAKI